MVFWSAEANTSTGAPFSIWDSSAPEAPKFMVTLTPGCSLAKAVFTAPKASVRLAAAETVRSLAAAGTARDSTKVRANSRLRIVNPP